MNTVIAYFGIVGGFVEFMAGFCGLMYFLIESSNGLGVLGSITLLFLVYCSAMSSAWAFDNWKNK